MIADKDLIILVSEKELHYYSLIEKRIIRPNMHE
jgi:hypothetical protein